jgi:hypothetical protein
MSDDLGKLYNDMQCGSVYAIIKWLRHPYVCGSDDSKTIADLVETEINVRNDQAKELTKERDAYKKSTEILWEALACANNQWGDDYLWRKFRLREEMDRARAIIEELTKKAQVKE